MDSRDHCEHYPLVGARGVAHWSPDTPALLKTPVSALGIQDTLKCPVLLSVKVYDNLSKAELPNGFVLSEGGEWRPCGHFNSLVFRESG